MEEKKADIELSGKGLLQEKLMANTVFEFDQAFNRKKFLRNGFLLQFLCTLIGAGLGAIFFLIKDASGVTNGYIILGIGVGLGAFIGLILGLFLLIALRLKLVEEYGTGYGVGIGTNVFIGAIIGTLFGAAGGALFGLVLEALNYTIGTTFNYALYGMLIWIVLGLNIGVLIGLIASFGIFGIISGGAISGAVVGFIGMLAIFGPDIIILIGLVAGIVVGLLIGVLVKYSIKASLGIVEDVKCGFLDSLETDGGKDSKTEVRAPRKLRKKSRGSFLDFCECCGVGECLEVGEMSIPALLVILIAIPTIIFIVFFSFFAAKASVRFGGVVKRGALTALGASISITLVIGSNIGLTVAFHDLEIYYIVGIGAGLGLIFGSIIFLALWLSIVFSYLKITPSEISWKDRYSEGKISLEQLEDFDFIMQRDTQKGFRVEEEEYFRFYLKDGRSKEIIIDCWETPGESLSSDYIQTILLYYIEQHEERVIEKIDYELEDLIIEED